MSRLPGENFKKSYYAPYFEKVGSILLSASPCIRAFKKFKARVLKYYNMDSSSKNSLPVFFSCLNYLALLSYDPFKD